MNKLKTQKQQLKVALQYAEIIEDCDWKIEAGRHVNYYKSVREEALGHYGEAIGAIIESSIDIAVEFETKKISDGLFENLDKITKQTV